MTDDLPEQILILCDADGTPTGHAPRSVCHTAPGHRHLAIMVFLRDEDGRVLLQRRKHALWNDCWDLGGATHPLHVDGEDETLEAAALRCLEEEWNVRAPVERLAAFDYHAQDAHGAVEYEYCVVFAATCREEPQANPKHAFATRWTTLSACRAEIASDPDDYTPWARLALELI